MMTKKLYTPLSALVLSALLAACTSPAEETASALPPPSKLPVDVKVVRNAPLNQEEIVAGSILPNKQVAIMSEVSKKIISINFKDGSYVSKGQLLYKLDDADVLARLKQVHAELSLAKLNESRLSALLQSESVRQEEYDAANVKLQSLQAAEELLKVELSKTFIYAPFAGVTSLTAVHEGALVSPGMSLVSLQDQETVKIQFAVPEKYSAQLRTGKKVLFTTSHQDEKLTATITATEASVDAGSRTILVLASYSNANRLLKAGMSARVYFSTTSENDVAFMLPTEALIPGANGYAVFAVKNGAAKATPVTIGNRTESEALITSGLAEGDTVMISNILRTGEGVPVQIVSAK